MLSFHNDPAIKEKYLSRVISHREADEIIKGIYWENGKGCAVGCTIHGNDHSKYETELGIPRILARLEDGIFENIPNERAKIWPEQFLSAIKVGSDLSSVWPKFAIWLLIDEKYGVIKFCKNLQTKEIIKRVAEGYSRYKEITLSEWLEIKDAAYAADAAAYAAYAAYAAAAAAAAYAAADAAAYSADAAAAAAAYAAAYADDAYAAAYADDAKTKWRLAQADKLLELLSEYE